MYCAYSDFSESNKTLENEDDSSLYLLVLFLVTCNDDSFIYGLLFNVLVKYVCLSFTMYNVHRYLYK
jgi:hypothetical protein